MCEVLGLPLLGRIPFDRNFARTFDKGEPILDGSNSTVRKISGNCEKNSYFVGLPTGLSWESYNASKRSLAVSDVQKGNDMKFVCLKCETYMTFEKVEKPAEGTLGVFFECPSCQSRFSMVTNPGETQMVSSLGVQLGGRTDAQKPLEMTRGGLEENVSAGMGQMAAYLNDKIQGGQPAETPALAASAVPATGSGETGEGSGCPFSAMVAQMGLGSSGQQALQFLLQSNCYGHRMRKRSWQNPFLCAANGQK